MSEANPWIPCKESRGKTGAKGKDLELVGPAFEGHPQEHPGLGVHRNVEISVLQKSQSFKKEADLKATFFWSMMQVSTDFRKQSHLRMFPTMRLMRHCAAMIMKCRIDRTTDSRESGKENKRWRPHPQP